MIAVHEPVIPELVYRDHRIFTRRVKRLAINSLPDRIFRKRYVGE